MGIRVAALCNALQLTGFLLRVQEWKKPSIFCRIQWKCDSCRTGVFSGPLVQSAQETQNKFAEGLFFRVFLTCFTYSEEKRGIRLTVPVESRMHLVVFDRLAFRSDLIYAPHIYPHSTRFRGRWHGGRGIRGGFIFDWRSRLAAACRRQSHCCSRRLPTS